jgi:hypothetical protein
VAQLRQEPEAKDTGALAKKALEKAKEALSQAQERQKKYADEGRLQKEFEVGDRVYLSTDGLSLRLKGAPTKLLPRRIGPYEILEKLYNFFPFKDK